MLIKSILIILCTIQIILSIYGLVLIHQIFKNGKKWRRKNEVQIPKP